MSPGVTNGARGHWEAREGRRAEWRNTRPADLGRRYAAEREARGDWSQADLVWRLGAHSNKPLPEDGGLLRNWKRWESGTYPDDFYRPLIAKAFGTVTAAMFPGRTP